VRKRWRFCARPRCVPAPPGPPGPPLARRRPISWGTPRAGSARSVHLLAQASSRRRRSPGGGTVPWNTPPSQRKPTGSADLNRTSSSAPAGVSSVRRLFSTCLCSRAVNPCGSVDPAVPTPQFPWGGDLGWHSRVLARPWAAARHFFKLANAPATLRSRGSVFARGSLPPAARSGWRACCSARRHRLKGHSSTGRLQHQRSLQGQPLRPDQSRARDCFPFRAAAAGSASAAPLSGAGHAPRRHRQRSTETQQGGRSVAWKGSGLEGR